MTTLVPMRAEIYAEYIESSIAGYAEENVASRRWPEEGAIERSRNEFNSLLPLGLATPDNYLYEIRADHADTTVGYIWLAVVVRHGIRTGYIYDVEIKERYRRNGHARQAFLALEPIAAGLGVGSIGLHVFGQNTGAQSLYQQLGYAVTGINMQKQLG